MNKKKYLYSIEGIHIAMDKIHQGHFEVVGNHLLINKKEVWFQGDKEEIPFISGNSIRGKLRRLIMEDLCRLIDYKFKDDMIWQSFFQGGSLQGGDPYLNADMWDKFQKLLPSVSLWAFSLGNQTLEGKLIVEDMELCCEENKLYLKEEYHDLCKNQAYYFIAENQFTRREERLIESKDSSQMLVKYDYLIQGSKFYHAFKIRKHPSDLEISCLHHAILLWTRHPIIGGKSNIGFGKVKLCYSDKLDDSIYLKHISQNKKEIIEFLDEITKEMIKKRKKNRKNRKNSKKKIEEEEEEEEEEKKVEEGINYSEPNMTKIEDFYAESTDNLNSKE